MGIQQQKTLNFWIRETHEVSLNINFCSARVLEMAPGQGNEAESRDHNI